MPNRDRDYLQNRQHHRIGRKIKFYEKNDTELDESGMLPASELRIDRPRNLEKFATLPNRKKAISSLTDVTSNLKVSPAYSGTDRTEILKNEKRFDRNHVHGDVHLDENENMKPTAYRSGSWEYKYRERRRGHRKNSLEESSPSSASSTSKGETSTSQVDEQAISFLPGEEIGRIYQSKKQISQREVGSSPDPREYQWKIVESKKNLQKLKKSISDEVIDHDFEDIILETDISNHEKNTIPQNPVHEKISKQDSNTSISSNLSTSSTLSKRLLALSEDTKDEKLPGKWSQKERIKNLSWKQSSLDREKYEKTKQKRSVVPAVQYEKDDFEFTTKSKEYSPSYNRPRTKHEERLGNETVPSNVTVEFDDQSKKTTRPHMKYKTLQDEVEREGKNKTNLEASTRQLSSLQLDDEGKNLGNESKSRKFNSMPRMAARYVFKVDLDEHFNDSLSQSKNDRYKRRRARKIDDAQSSESGSANLTKDTSERTNLQEDDMGGAINRSSQHAETTPPSSTRSKRLQVRPWNLLGHLTNNVTQTTHRRMSDTNTQTSESNDNSEASIKAYKTTGVQTEPLPLQDFGTQICPLMKTVDVQTETETSEGSTISLDNLIRLGAIKRTKSLALGVSASPERPRDRSASTDFGTNMRHEITEAIDNKASTISSNGTQTSGKIASYNWSENKKFVKIFVSYSGIHLLPSKNIQVKTNGINLLLTVDECVSHTPEGEELRTLTSTLYLNRLRRPVSCLSYNIQRDMITIMLRKQKQTPWNALHFNGANV